jgi:glucose/arabinose dehydrogenase
MVGKVRRVGLWFGIALAAVVVAARVPHLRAKMGLAAFTRPIDRRVDATSLRPGTPHHIRVEDMPPPYATPSADNPPRVVDRPANAWPQVPPGFRVRLYEENIKNPRALCVAPNGDVFVADSRPGALRVLRGLAENGQAEHMETYATGLSQPFGMAFYPPGSRPEWLYVANTDAVVRFHYKSGDLHADKTPQHIVDLPGGGLLRGGGHWTRDIAFSHDGKKMFVSVGSRSNADDVDNRPSEHLRANVLEFTPDGKGLRVYASGVRNAVGIAVSPRTGELWASVNERDDLGDDLVPDYVTHLQDGGFYGWPWYYIGPHQDPRHAGKHPELAEQVITPDVLLPAHSASLQMVFYEGTQFPADYRGDIFAALHGSWNRSVRSGYGVVRVQVDRQGHARGGFDDFVTGFVTPQGEVWGRPVGVAVASDGALLVSDDGGGCVWRVEAVPSKQ